MSHRRAKAVRAVAKGEGLVYRTHAPRTYVRYGKPARLHTVRTMAVNPDGKPIVEERQVQLHAQGGQLVCGKRRVYQHLKRYLQRSQRRPTVNL